MKNNTILAIGIGALVAGITTGVVAMCYAMSSKRKVSDVCDKLDTTIDKVSRDVMIDTDVKDRIVEAAIEKAAEIKVQKAVDNAVYMLKKEIRNDINNEIRTAVKAIYPDIRKTCTERVTEEVSKINVKDLTDAVREDARAKVVAKFDGELDDILSKFNSDLDNVTKIYRAISNKITGNSSDNSNPGFKISLT